VIFFQILILAILQGACELLPVSSSAHVIIAEKLMGIDPSTPEMTLLLVMLHTGTMLAVIIYFWQSWKVSFFQSRSAFFKFAKLVLAATFLTVVIGLILKVLIEKVFLGHVANAEVEMIFGNLGIVTPALAVAGILIIYSGSKTRARAASGHSRSTGYGSRVRAYEVPRPLAERGSSQLDLAASTVIGAVQALCLPFRGFSRSGATISTGLLMGLSKRTAEEFSFALVVILTPPVILKEVHRLLKAHISTSPQGLDLFHLFLPSIIGMAASFMAGLLALKWLSSWLEAGRWKYFGYYCLAVSALAFTLYLEGF
jgi:undecaprenyl-diphosphatase